MFAGSLVALVTPMRGDGSLDLTAWNALLEWHLEQGSNGVVVGGTTGESATLDGAELEQLCRAAVAMCRGRIPVLAGIGSSSTAQSIERARTAAATGVDALLVVTPAYNRPAQEGLYRHFEAVVRAARRPVVLYNVPSRTAVDLLPATVERLAQLPEIVGIKEAVASGGRIRELLERRRAGFDVLSGDDATAREAILAGASGTISVTANVAPRAMSEMVAAARSGAAAQAAGIDATLAPLHRALFSESNPIPVKWALARMGRIGPDLRLPLTPLSDGAQPALIEAMRAAGLDTPGQSPGLALRAVAH